MKTLKILIIFVVLILFSCDDDNINNGLEDPCSTGGQGFSISENCGECPQSTFFDNDLIVAELITGDPNGDYYHFYSVPPADFIEFYSYGVSTGSTSTLDVNWQSASSSYLYLGGNPIEDPGLAVNTIQGGSNAGDNVTIEIMYAETFENELFSVDATFCVTLDEIIIFKEYVYITDGASLKVVDVSNPLIPNLEVTLPFPTSHYVKTFNNSVALVGQTSVTEPYVSLVNISNPPISSVLSSLPKSNTTSILTDSAKIDDVVILTDLHLRNKKFDLDTNQAVDVGDAHGGFCITNVADAYFMLLDGLGASTYNVDNNSQLSYPFLTNTAILNWTSLVENRHDWIGNDGVFSYVANIVDQKFVKLAATATQINEISSINISGYPSALAIFNNYAFVTMTPTSVAPYNAGFDGIKMIDLSTMQVIDSAILSSTSGVVANGNYIYVTDSNGLHIYNISLGTLNLISTYSQGFGNYIAL